MSDLTDALKYVAQFDPPDAYERSLIAQVVAAARRVAEAPEVWWCAEHEELGVDDEMCTWGWDNGHSPNDCRMVRKLLVDPDNL